MNGILEFKSYTAEIKDIDFEKSKVTGFWASYGNKDYDRDVILEGAAKKTIQERGPLGSNEIFFLNQHNWAQPMGKPYILEDQKRGIYFESDVTKASYGKDALILYSEGLVKEHSIGFATMKEAWVKPNGEWDDMTYREISEIKLYEGSAVTLGANPNTPFTGFKSKSLKENEETISKIVKLLRNGTLTDETFLQLEIALKQLQKEAFELGKQSLQKVGEPDLSTQEKQLNKPIIIDVDAVFEKMLLN